MGPESGEIPQWMRVSDHRDLEEETRSHHELKLKAAVCALSLFLLMSIVSAFMYPPAFHLPMLAAFISAFVVMTQVRWKKNDLVTKLYAGVAIPANAGLTYVAANEDPVSFAIALSGLILLSGATGLLIVARTKKRLSRRAKAVIMTAVLSVYVGCWLAMVCEHVEGVLVYAWLWLWAALAPMTFLVVITPLVLVAYHRDDVTMPADKWV